jgi:hypothetical protein
VPATCIRIPSIGNVPAALILVIILVVFAAAAHAGGMTAEMIMLLITTITGAALRFGKPQPHKAR